MYKVICSFIDLQDNEYAYEVGDVFPRLNYEPSEARIAELSGKNNRRGMVLIEKVEEQPVIEKYTKTDINRMNTQALKKLANELGLDSEKTGAELKRDLIKSLSL